MDAAKLSARKEADLAGEERSRRLAAERDFRERMRRDDEAAWGAGHRKSGVLRRDEEGDVVMDM